MVLQKAIDDLKHAVLAAELTMAELKKQKDLEKPPPHKWEHGDVFENRYGTTMICIEDLNRDQGSEIRVFCLTGIGCDMTHSPATFLIKAKFLFNIKEKL